MNEAAKLAIKIAAALRETELAGKSVSASITAKVGANNEVSFSFRVMVDGAFAFEAKGVQEAMGEVAKRAKRQSPAPANPREGK